MAFFVKIDSALNVLNIKINKYRKIIFGIKNKIIFTTESIPINAFKRPEKNIVIKIPINNTKPTIDIQKNSDDTECLPNILSFKFFITIII